MNYLPQTTFLKWSTFSLYFKIKSFHSRSKSFNELVYFLYSSTTAEVAVIYGMHVDYWRATAASNIYKCRPQHKQTSKRVLYFVYIYLLIREMPKNCIELICVAKQKMCCLDIFRLSVPLAQINGLRNAFIDAVKHTQNVSAVLLYVFGVV